MNLFEQINEKKAELDRIIAEYGEKAIKEYLSEFWEQNTDIEAIRWEQYTPYYNDGDPCVFHVHEVRAKPLGGSDEGGDYDDGFGDTWHFEYEFYDVEKDREKRIELATQKYAFLPNLKKLSEVWRNNEATMLVVFGDHVQITADREKISVDEYEHD